MGHFFSPTFLHDLGLKAARVAEIAVFFEVVVWLLQRTVDRALRPALVSDASRDPAWRLKRRDRLRAVTRATVRWLVYLPAFLLIFENFGLRMSGLYVGLGVAILLIAVAGWRVLQDLVCGYACLLEDVVAPGDTVEIDGVSGEVVSVTLRSVRFRSADDLTYTTPFSIIRRLGARPKPDKEKADSGAHSP